MCDAVVDAAHEALTDHRAHRATHEAELERGGDQFETLQGPGHDDQRVALTGGLLRDQQPVLVTLGIAELERVLGLDATGDLDAGGGVQEASQPFTGTDAHVVAALRADHQVALELGAVEHRVASLALDPKALGNRPRPALGLDSRRHDLFKPGHGQSSGDGATASDWPAILEAAS